MGVVALDQTLHFLKNEYPNLNPRALAVAEQITLLLDLDCRKDGRASPSETGCSLTWVHRRLFCHVDTQNDDDPPDAPITIMIHTMHKSSPFSWEDDIEYPTSPEEAAKRVMELWNI